VSHKRDCVIGRIPVEAALRAGRRRAHKLLLLASGRGLDDLRACAAGVPVQELPRHELDRLAGGGTHQGVILLADPLPLLDLKTWLRHPQPENSLVAILDGIEDPHNFGAIVRSAAACGAHAVLFGKDRAAPVSSTALKAAAGAMEYISLIQVVNVPRAAEQLKEAGYWIAALDADAPQTLWEAKLTGRVAMVIGNEGVGIRRLVRETCDLHLRVPLTGPITSLNASVSAGIAFAEYLRQTWEQTKS